jgi:hypothetical protein
VAVYKKLTEDFKVPFMLEDPYRVEETPKHKAVREAIANCLANADFFQKGGVVIERYIRQKLIMPLLEKGSLLRTIPDKPSSPNQKHIAKK